MCGKTDKFSSLLLPVFGLQSSYMGGQETRPSTKVEYRALAIIAIEISWFRMLLQDLQVVLPKAPIIWCDNVSAIALASNRVFHALTKAR